MNKKTYARHIPESRTYVVGLGESYEAILQYEMKEAVMHIVYTEVPIELRGQGKGTELMEACLAEIEKEGHQIVPVCSYVVMYLERNPQWAHLLN